jgi:hypothetical protein
LAFDVSSLIITLDEDDIIKALNVKKIDLPIDFRVEYRSSENKMVTNKIHAIAASIYRMACARGMFTQFEEQGKITRCLFYINDVENASTTISKWFPALDPKSNFFMLVKNDNGHIGCVSYGIPAYDIPPLNFDTSLLEQKLLDEDNIRPRAIIEAASFIN